MDIARITALLTQGCPESPLEIVEVAGGELLLDLPSECLVPVVAALDREEGFHHLTAITGSDTGRRIELLYHLWMGGGLTLRLHLDLAQPVVSSISGLVPIALWYEREVHEMLGVDFVGHPDLRPLLLPEDWTGPPPMRKEHES